MDPLFILQLVWLLLSGQTKPRLSATEILDLNVQPIWRFEVDKDIVEVELSTLTD
jgi:hypothetical protein